MGGTRIVDWASYLPEKVVTNDELAETLDTSDKWIRDHTGIRKRHIIDHEFNSGLTTGYMASQVAKQLLKNTNTDAGEIDLIIVATTTNDRIFPSCATYVQEQIGASNAFAFDVQAVCSGFIFTLITAHNFLQNHGVRKALVIGSETMSRVVNWQDRSTCILFGDGAGGCFLESDDDKNMIIDYQLCSDGSFADSLQANKYLTMEGSKVFRHAIEKMSGSVSDILARNKLSADDIKYIVPHQANKRITEGIAKYLNVQEDKLVSTIDLHANTSAASIPLTFNIIKKGLKNGDYLILTAFGGGFTWGSALLHY